MQARQHRGNCVLRGLARFQFPRDEMTDDFRVRLGQEDPAFGLKLVAKRLEILDDAIVHDGHVPHDMGVRIVFRGGAVRRPPGVRDADAARQRIVRQLR